MIRDIYVTTRDFILSYSSLVFLWAEVVLEFLILLIEFLVIQLFEFAFNYEVYLMTLRTLLVHYIIPIKPLVFPELLHFLECSFGPMAELGTRFEEWNFQIYLPLLDFADTLLVVLSRHDSKVAVFQTLNGRHPRLIIYKGLFPKAHTIGELCNLNFILLCKLS